MRRVAARDAFGRALGLHRLLQALLAHLQQFGLRPVEVLLRRRRHGAAHIGERALKLSDGPAQVGGRLGRHDPLDKIPQSSLADEGSTAFAPSREPSFS